VQREKSGTELSSSSTWVLAMMSPCSLVVGLTIGPTAAAGSEVVLSRTGYFYSEGTSSAASLWQVFGADSGTVLAGAS
jgi:hypothetical protein